MSQIVLVMSILVGLDGVEKMSKSTNNYIGVHDAPNDMFGKVMSIEDHPMPNYFAQQAPADVDGIAPKFRRCGFQIDQLCHS